MRTRFAVFIAAIAIAVGVVQPIYAFSGQPRFQLPWSDGTTWRLTGGPHSNVGYGRPWSSLDFAGPIAGHSYPVRAAAAGYVVRPCANWVRIRHGWGWETSYYHLAHIAVKAGQYVKQGAFLGYTSMQTGCGGSATGPHVHFSIKHNGEYVDIGGFVFGGWTVRDGQSQYLGCLVRDNIRKCAPGGQLYNYGA
jgi:murein DD-endopeptidase MepM/ murein hydrolase activator NlpD